MIAATQYRALPQVMVSVDGCYVQEAFNPPPVRADSPAVEVMTDLSRIASATVLPDATLDEANHSMILRGVRLLFVVAEDEMQRIMGVVTTTDILGEKSVLIAQARRCKRNALLISDVMAPVESMEALDLDEVKKASVGNIVATLKRDARAHALVVGRGRDGLQHVVGIFSASQIARQLGVQIQTHEMARTFAEIEALIVGV